MNSTSKKFGPRLLLVFALTAASLFFGACGQDYNSNTNDGAVEIDCATAGADFCAAVEVLQSQCINCHTQYHSSWASYADSDAYVNAGLVVRGNAMASSLITKLKNYGGNMPESAAQLPVSERDALVNWINGL